MEIQTRYSINRGDVFYVRFDNGYGSEMGVGRPVVVVSDTTNNNYNSPLYTCVYMTTSPKNIGTAIPLTTPHKRCWALCNQIFTYDSVRFGDRMCTLSAAEMEQIDAALSLVLGLKLHNPETDRRHAGEKADLIAKHEAEMAALKAAHEKELAAAKDEALGSVVDCEVQKRLYEKALNMLTELRFGKDIAAPKVVDPVVEEEPVVEEAPVVEEESAVEEAPVEEEPLVDINRCTLGDLCALGFPMATAKMIEAARPYMDVDDLRGVPGVTRIGYQLVEKRITVGDTAEFRKKPEPKKPKKVVEPEPVVEPVAEKVNVNTATAKEISEKAGINLTICYSIVGYRKKNGPYQSLDELTNVTNFGSRALKKYRDKMAV